MASEAAAVARLRVLQRHLCAVVDGEQRSGIAPVSAAAVSGARVPPITEYKPLQWDETFDESTVQHVLEANHYAVREKVRELMKTPLFLHRAYDIPVAEQRRLTLARLKAMMEIKAFNAIECKELPSKFLAAGEVSGSYDASLSILGGVQFSLWGASVYSLGTKKHRKLMPAINSLELPGCFALTELGHGSNARAIETEARYDVAAREFVIHTPSDMAQKIWIGNGAVNGKMAVVFARFISPDGEDRGVHGFLVPLRDMKTHEVLPGITIVDCGTKMGLNGVDNARMWFHNVRIPHENMLDRHGSVDAATGAYSSPFSSANKRFVAIIGELIGGRVSLSVNSLGVLKSALTIAIRYGVTRRQFGDPSEPVEQVLLDFPTYQMRLLPHVAAVYAHTFGINYLKERYDYAAKHSTAEVVKEVHILASAYKPIVTWLLRDALQECREACGGVGFAAVNRIGMFKADTDVYNTFEGDNNVLLQQVAKSLLDEFRAVFSPQKATLAGALRFLQRTVETSVVGKNPYNTHRTSRTHLRNHVELQRAFEYREAKLVRMLAMTMRRNMTRRKMKPFDAWNDCGRLILHLGRAHCERVSLEQFIGVVRNGYGAGAEDGGRRVLGKPERYVMDLVCSLYGLSRIHADLAWYLEYGYVARNKAKAIHAEIASLCAELRPHAMSLVASFGVPDHILGAPLAMQWDQCGSPEFLWP